MSGNMKLKKDIVVYKTPRRGEIWIIKDDDIKDDNEHLEYDNSLQRGTRPCIIVSNNNCNTYSPVVEIVYTTTKQKNKLPTHFITETTPKRSTVLCEQIMSVPKDKLKNYHDILKPDEIKKLNKCLRISLGL